MIVKHFGCTAIHNKALYKCLIHSFILFDFVVSALAGVQQGNYQTNEM